MHKTKDHQGEASGLQKPVLRNLWRNLLIPFVVIMVILCLAALFIPTLDGPNSHRNAREAVAVGNLHRIATLQASWASGL